jgi:hypothetical protein
MTNGAVPSKSRRTSKSAAHVTGQAAAHMSAAKAAMPAAESAAVASARRGMSTAALGADRHYRDNEEERREGKQATHEGIIRHFSDGNSSGIAEGRGF